ncbi:aldo/keto reductase [Asticcacaulis sp. BYS171W]|uniref:Aldo/keto reductase n=1 Tax=Asticcacaulis aquaticus TaxID=2984212 RepID=A0ABT5HQE6_9CAUL|nr:aldo/keto reductase [Asticcacaulis aquaticus]MDC7682209.1 aldo/keto reductase [Asticcacaulis aquaticus]
MRYRPFGRSGQALSTLGLTLSWSGARQSRQMIHRLIMTALENGINTYHFESAHPDLLKTAAEALSVVERRLLFISVNAHEEGANDPAAQYALTPLRDRLKLVIKESGLKWIDLLMFHATGFDRIPDNSWAFIDSLRRANMLKFTGAAANTDRIQAVVDDGRFNILKTVFDIDTSWDKRHLLDYAISRGMTIFGHDFYPEAYRKASDVVPKAARRGFFGSRPADPLAGSGTYAFLHQTNGWTAEELCLSFALTQPTLSTMLIRPDTPDHLEALTEVPERLMPTSVPAQIEMARFSLQAAAARREEMKKKA